MKRVTFLTLQLECSHVLLGGIDGPVKGILYISLVVIVITRCEILLLVLGLLGPCVLGRLELQWCVFYGYRVFLGDVCS